MKTLSMPALVAALLLPLVALAQIPAPIPTPTSAVPTPAADDPRYALPAAVSPEAKAIMTPLLAAQRASYPARAAIATDFAAQYARSVKDADAKMADAIKRTGVTITPDTIGGVPVLRIVPVGAARDGRLLVYVHGGGWVQGSAASTASGAAMFAVATGLPVISVDYTLAPAQDFRGVTAQLVAFYRALLAQGHRPRQIGLFGDSAGGNIVAGGTLRLRDEGLPIPGALVLLSPCTDLGTGGDTRTTLAGFEPALDVAATLDGIFTLYAGKTPGALTNPWASPVYGDFSKPYPPTLIQGGTREVLLSDFVRQYQAIRAGGGSAVLDLYEGMPHVFQTYLKDTPEGKQAIATFRDFFLLHLAKR
ncbi:alpha/beta hydrolase fold domain-containing protein [Sphingomonas alpina]|uniref:Alpha/beta hydrolase n=1 Tax=Sphingomonas alpina TaxID=653931 RepID=A0A7H0LFM1_9SPHN|nr:alpha/beta hydrolase [Sphingomonas alpina]QNQ08474.1 alpha/beta hydrolase [Sphingomonas alpina]